MYAVVELQWHQYIVTKDMELVVDNVKWDESDITFDKVLCVFNQDWSTLEVGSPFVNWVKVIAQRLEDKKWTKIRVVKFRRKNRYERNFGFRPHQTVLKIKDIVINE